MGLNFLDFLRSGHTDIAVFAHSRQNKISQSEFTPPKRRRSVEDKAAERRRPVAAVLRSIGGIVKGDRQIMNHPPFIPPALIVDYEEAGDVCEYIDESSHVIGIGGQARLRLLPESRE